MKKLILSSYTIISVLNSFGQLKQGTLISDAKYYKRTNNYSKSLELFIEALKTSSKISDDYYYAVKVAVLNINQSLAFKWLDDYSKIDNYRSTDDIKSDSSLFELHNNPKWNEFLTELNERNNQREKNYNQQLKKELDQIYFDDQDIRIKYVGEMNKPNADTSLLDSMMQIMVKVDSINLKRVSDILDKYGWLSNSEVDEKSEHFIIWSYPTRRFKNSTKL